LIADAGLCAKLRACRWPARGALEITHRHKLGLGMLAIPALTSPGCGRHLEMMAESHNVDFTKVPQKKKEKRDTTPGTVHLTKKKLLFFRT
jgi:hypothetical protein